MLSFYRMGMACALAAFFGVPLGGSLFALEINNRFGIEYYEHTMEAIFSGTICLCVFRALNHVEIGAIWEISPEHLPKPTPLGVIIGGGIGLLGALAAAGFAFFHQRIVMAAFKYFHLMHNSVAIRRALIGATPMLFIGVVYPRTMFWGEAEFQVISTGAPADELPHVFPTTGLGALQMDSFWPALLIGITKLIAISFTVAAGYRGGFIFPFFAAGAAFGRALCYLFPNLSPVIACLCMAAGINVAITRTALATTLILGTLAGEANAIPPILAASIASMFATSYMPFIRSQVKRQDIGPTPTATPATTPAAKRGKTWSAEGSTGTKLQYGAIDTVA
jgi:H+/Cl- antiporter ClcA